MLRTFGVPARLAGTPAWHGAPKKGNHNWVEVWLGGEGSAGSGGARSAGAASGAALDDGLDGWRFIEGAPAGGGETFANPCDKWFCNRAHFNASGGTRAFAAGYGPPSGVHYPMAWDLPNTGVVGVDRTAYYEAACAACG